MRVGGGDGDDDDDDERLPGKCDALLKIDVTVLETVILAVGGQQLAAVRRGAVLKKKLQKRSFKNSRLSG